MPTPFPDRLRQLVAQFPELRGQPGLIVSLAQSMASDGQIADAASFAQATSWRRVLESVPADHAQVMWDGLAPSDRRRVLASGYRPAIARNEGVGLWAAVSPPSVNVNAVRAAVEAQQQAEQPERAEQQPERPEQPPGQQPEASDVTQDQVQQAQQEPPSAPDEVGGGDVGVPGGDQEQAG